VQVIVQVLQVLQRFSSGAERFRFNRPVVQSSGVQRCRQVQSCRGAEVVLMCRVAEVVLRFSRGGCAVDCAGAEVVQRLCRGARFSNKCGAEQVLVV
jgi:hypothetical protein